MSNYNEKTGHPILGIILGIIGIAAALLLCFIGGIIGGVIAGVFGLAALLIGMSARKKGGKGMGAFVIGAMAIVLAFFMTIGSIGFYKDLQKKTAATDVAPLMTKYLDKPELGLVGLIMNIPQDEGSLEELTKELDALTKIDLNTAQTAQ